ncbi:MAG: Rpn family recombination-promoting nuclease/putative transposase [Myxococcaceae bacterium]
MLHPKTLISNVIFASPKTDFVFKRIFGDEHHKGLLIQFLNTLLELDEAHQIISLNYLPPEQRPPVEDLKYSIVDVKCQDMTGRYYVIEMQILEVDAFENRVVYNANKMYIAQLESGKGYETLCDVFAISICDFMLWPTPPKGDSRVPMLSRWQMREKQSGEAGLSQVQYIFMELPKYSSGEQPKSLIEKWAYFFKEAPNLNAIPSFLQEEPFIEAFEVAKTSGFSLEDWAAYENSLQRDRDFGGILKKVQKDGMAAGMAAGIAAGRAAGMVAGKAEGRTEGLRESIIYLCDVLGIIISIEQHAALEKMEPEELLILRERLKIQRQWDLA